MPARHRQLPTSAWDSRPVRNVALGRAPDVAQSGRQRPRLLDRQHLRKLQFSAANQGGDLGLIPPKLHPQRTPQTDPPTDVLCSARGSPVFLRGDGVRQSGGLPVTAATVVPSVVLTLATHRVRFRAAPEADRGTPIQTAESGRLRRSSYRSVSPVCLPCRSSRVEQCPAREACAQAQSGCITACLTPRPPSKAQVTCLEVTGRVASMQVST